MFRRCAGLLGPLARTSPVQWTGGVHESQRGGTGDGAAAAAEAEKEADASGPTEAQAKLKAETRSMVYSGTPAAGMDIDVQHVVKKKQLRDGVRRAFEDEEPPAPTAAEVAAARAAEAAKAERRIGRVIYWNYERGWGKLLDVVNNREIMVHSNEVEGQATHRRGLQLHQTVEYTVGATAAVAVTRVGGGEPRPVPRHGTRHAAGYGNLY